MKLSEKEFKRFAAFAKAAEPSDYLSGYQRGIRRNFHGEVFGSDDEHALWMAMDGHRAEMGRGYRDGFEGKPPEGYVMPTEQRVERSTEKLLASGGRRLQGIRLTPEAVQVLEALEAQGESVTAVLNRLLIEAGEG